MQGSQKEEERNLESHNRITLSEVISLNLTICRSREKKIGKEERDRVKRERNEVGALAESKRDKKKERKRHIQ